MTRICHSFLFAALILQLSPVQALAQNFWQPTNGPYAAYVYTLAVNPSGHLFAGTDHGLFRSTDNGDQWIAINTGLIDNEILSIVINPATGDIFVGTDGGGIFRSTNNGESWTRINTGLSNLIIQALAIDSNGNLFAGSNGGGAFRSTNNGSTWSPINTGLTNDRIQTLAVNLAGDIFAGTYRDGVFRSTDNGDSWTQFLPGNSNNQNDIRSLAINSNDDIFAGTFGGGIYRSQNNGTSWSEADNNLTTPYVYALTINASGHIFAGTAVDIGNAGVFRSTNNGDSWIKVSSGLSDDDVRSLAVSTTGDVIAGTEGSGVFRSTDNGSNWFPVNLGLTGLLIEEIAISTNGTLFAGTSYGLFRSSDGGDNWARVPSSLTYRQVTQLAINGSGHIFAAPGPYRSTNNGDNWTQVDNGLPNTVITDIDINAFGHLFAGTFNNGAYRSTDNGDNWTQINIGLNDLSIEVLAINANADIFAGTDGFNGSGIYRSTDFGDSWSLVNNGLPTNHSPSIRALAVSPNGDIYAAETFDGVFRSTNNGNTWTNTTLDVFSVQTLIVNSVSDIFAGSFSNGAYRSRDNGNSWTEINTVISGQRIETFALDADQYLFVGTDGRGVLRSVLPSEALSPPAQPVLALPPNGITNRATTLSLSWNAPAEAETYRLQVSTGASFTEIVFDDSTITATSHQVGPLAPSTTYYWRVMAKNAGGSSDWSSVWSFMTGAAAPSQPMLLSPSDGATDQSTNPTLQWNTSSNAESYRLQVSAGDADFTTTVFDDSSITTTSQQVGPLAGSTTHYWRVKAKNTAGSSDWSDIWSFTTEQVFQSDLTISRINLPEMAILNIATPIRASVKNAGINMQSGFAASYQVNSDPAVSENFQRTIPPGDSVEIEFATPWVPQSFGNHTIAVQVDLAGDQRPENDGISKAVNVARAVNFCSADVTKTISDNDTTVSILTIDDDLLVGDLNVKMYINHNNDQDLDVFLSSPNGTKMELFSDVGGTGNNFGSTCSPAPDFVIDDQSETGIDDAGSPFVGSFRSEDSILGTYSGESANGTWSLIIVDDASVTSGTLNCWCLEIEQAPANDVGITAIELPKFHKLGDSLPISVTVKNFGSEAKSNFPVSYSTNAGPSVTETFSSILEAGESAVKTFTDPWTPTTEGTYSFTTWTGLSGDARVENDTLSIHKKVVVRETNAAPVLVGIGDFTVRAGLTKQIRFSAFDADADSIFFSIIQNPGFLSIRDFTQDGDTASATLQISPSRNLEGDFLASVEVRDRFNAKSSKSFAIRLVPRLLYPPINLTATHSVNGTQLNWDPPHIPPNSPYAGTWQGSTSQNRDLFMSISDDGFVDSVSVQFSLNFGSFGCLITYVRTGLVAIDGDSVNVFMSTLLTNVATTLHGSFTSESSISGTYDGFSGSFFIYCGTLFSFGTGGTQLSAGTWQATRTGPGSGTSPPALLGYDIYRSSQPDARLSGTLIGSIAAGTTSFTDPNPQTGFNYYQVTARYDLGESDPNQNSFVHVITSIENQASLPSDFSLGQNYPNPFNPETEIFFALPRQSHVVLRIYNLLGKEVRTLVDRPFEAGHHSVRWRGRDTNGRPVASGVYLYRIRAGDFVRVRKMSLMR